jgi:hypothetical protein
MKKIYTAFSFNGVVYSDLINVSLENNMHSENMRGNRSLLREKIPGRDIPYFYAVEDEALEFDVVFALTTPKTKAELKVIMRNLITQTGYKELSFGNYFEVTATRTNASNSLTSVDTSNLKVGGSISGTGIPNGTTIASIGTGTLTMSANASSSGTNTVRVYMRESPIYKVIFDGESKLDFVGANVYNSGVATLKYFGYFTLRASADRPYGFENLTGSILASLTGQADLNNTGDLPVFPNIVITNGTTAYNVPIRIFNATNETSIGFTSLAGAVSPSLIGEVITINADLKTISSTVGGVYNRWQRNDLKLEVGINDINLQEYIGSPTPTWQNITTNPWASVVFTVQAPTFIKI